MLKPVLMFLPERINKRAEVTLLKILHGPYAGVVYTFERYEAWKEARADAKRDLLSLDIEGDAAAPPTVGNGLALWKRYANARVVLPTKKKTKVLRGAGRAQVQVPVALMQQAAKRTQNKTRADAALSWPRHPAAPTATPPAKTTTAPAAPVAAQPAAAKPGKAEPAKPAAAPAKGEPSKPAVPAKAEPAKAAPAKAEPAKAAAPAKAEPSKPAAKDSKAADKAPAKAAKDAKTAPAAGAPASAPAAAAPAAAAPVDDPTIRPTEVEMMRMLKELSAQVEELRVALVKHDKGPEQA